MNEVNEVADSGRDCLGVLAVGEMGQELYDEKLEDLIVCYRVLGW